MIILYPLPQKGLIEENVLTNMRLEFDGNRVWAQKIHLPAVPFEIEVRGMKNTPSLWYSKGKRANQVPHGIRVNVQ